MFKAIRSHKFYVPLLTIAGCAGLFLVYYFFYVSWQRNYANERAFRVLSVAGDQLNRRANLDKVLAAALAYEGGPQKYLETFKKNEISDVRSDWPCPKVAVAKEREGDMTLEFDERGGGSTLRAIFRRAPRPDGKSCFVSGTVDLNEDLRTRFHNVTEDYFEDILIATSQGKVLYQQSPNGPRIASLNVLVAPKAGEKPPKPAAVEQPHPAPERPRAASEQPAGAFQDASEFSNVIDIKLAGTAYKLYVQPLPIALIDSQKREVKPVLCGLWRADRLQSEVVSIPYPVLIWGTLVALSLFGLIWPLLKVAYMSPSERLRRKHIFYLSFSALFACTMLTLVVLNASYTLRSNEESQEQLKYLSKRIDSRVRAELGLALDFLDALDQSALVRAELGKGKDAPWKPTRDFLASSLDDLKAPVYPYFNNVFWVDASGNQQYKLTVDGVAAPRTSVLAYRYFTDVRDGLNLTSLDAPAGKAPRMFRFDSLYSPNTGEFFAVLATPYRPPTEKQSDLSAKLREDPVARVLVGKFLSLVDPVVPAGFGFAVVSRDGKVQFHSVAARNLIENFFKECGDDPALKSLVMNGGNGVLETSYMGKRQEMRVQPMPYLGVPAPSLIVFRDVNYFQTVNVACLLVFALLAALFGVPFLIGLVIYVLRQREYPLEGLWPSDHDVRKYTSIITANLCLTLAFAIRFQWMRLNEMLIGVLTIAAAAVIFTCLPRRWGEGTRALAGKAVVLLAILVVALGAFWSSHWPIGWGARTLALAAAVIYVALSWPRRSEKIAEAASKRVTLKHVYLAMAVSTLAVLVVVPCFGLFKISYDTVNRLALQAAQVARLDQLSRRADRAKEYFRPRTTVDRREEYVSSRIKEPLDRYDDPVFNPLNNSQLNDPAPKDMDVSTLEAKIAPATANISQLNHPPPKDMDVSILEPTIAQATAWFPSNRLGAELRQMAMSMKNSAKTPPTAPPTAGTASRKEELVWTAVRSQAQTNNPKADDSYADDPEGASDPDDEDELLALKTDPTVVGTDKLVGVYPLWKLPLRAAILLAGLAALLTAWLSYLIGKVFMAELEEVPQLTDWVLPETGGGNLLIMGHPKSGKSDRARGLPDVDVLDMAEAVTTGKWPKKFKCPSVVVDHFEFDIDNPDTCLAKLKVLERIIYAEKKHVILLSAVDPMFYLAAGNPEIVTPAAAHDESPAQILDRWASVLSLFEKRKMQDVTENYFDRFLAEQDQPCHKEFVNLVKAECDHTAQLRRIGLDMLVAHCNDRECMSKAQFLEELLDRTDSYYRVLWATCTKDERLVLFQLGEDGWANPKNGRALQQLQRRRILRRGSGFRIMNESFRRFIRTAQTPDELARWEKEEEQSTWSAVKLGLGTALMMLGAWLLYTQQDAFQMGIGYLAALGTASGAVINLARNMKGRGGPEEKVG
jgi:hypothetical protein